MLKIKFSPSQEAGEAPNVVIAIRSREVGDDHDAEGDRGSYDDSAASLIVNVDDLDESMDGDKNVTMPPPGKFFLRSLWTKKD